VKYATVKPGVPARHASFGSAIRNGIKESLIALCSLADCNGIGLLMCGAQVTDL